MPRGCPLASASNRQTYGFGRMVVYRTLKVITVDITVFRGGLLCNRLAGHYVLARVRERRYLGVLLCSMLLGTRACRLVEITSSSFVCWCPSTCAHRLDSRAARSIINTATTAGSCSTLSFRIAMPQLKWSTGPEFSPCCLNVPIFLY